MEAADPALGHEIRAGTIARKHQIPNNGTNTDLSLKFLLQ